MVIHNTVGYTNPDAKVEALIDARMRLYDNVVCAQDQMDMIDDELRQLGVIKDGR